MVVILKGQEAKRRLSSYTYFYFPVHPDELIAVDRWGISVVEG
jgi:hypothetical protein